VSGSGGSGSGGWPGGVGPGGVGPGLGAGGDGCGDSSCMGESLPGYANSMHYWVQLATEQFPPSELVDQAIEAERAGFDGLNVSDHLQPWWEPGESGQAWTLLGAIGHATDRIAIGTGVTAPSTATTRWWWRSSRRPSSR
jgi:hypothetical protein